MHARRTLRRLDGCVASLQQYKGGRPYPELNQLLYDLKNGFGTAMDDDLNISAALASIFRLVKQLNRLMAGANLGDDQIQSVLDAFRQLDVVLDVFNFNSPQAHDEVSDLIRRREDARRAGDWNLADTLRDQLMDMGVVVRDTKI